MDKKLTFLQRAACRLIGWNPNILAESKESSFRALRKYMSAIAILSFIWGTIGYTFAGRYVGLESIFSKAIIALIFIIVITCIERFVILNEGSKFLTSFRIVLAILMSILGSTIFDQIIFSRDVDVIMREVRTNQINEEVPKRLNIVNAEIDSLTAQLENCITKISKLNEKIANTPAQIRSASVTTKTEKDSTGKSRVVGRDITNTTILNPQWEQLTAEREMAESEAKGLREKQNDLFERKLKIEDNVRNEYENIETGFLEELKAMVILLKREPIALVFYIFLFLFLTSLELLVVTSKVGEKKCDYDLIVEHQRNVKEKLLSDTSSVLINENSKI